jgi:hypothetical protein
VNAQVAESDATAGNFEIVADWQAQTPENAAAIAAFWARENALQDAAAIAHRLKQVVVHARTPEGDVAGVATAIAMVPPRFGQPMYYFRAFVGKAARSTTLVRELTLRSCDVLEAHAREHGYPCIGVLLELENDKFNSSLRKPVWWNPRFYYVGRSERGLELRAYYFDGARLKSPGEVQRMALPAR